ncbi:LCP family protein [Anaerococcus porci]|uniref:LCP family protein n=1 Tax=Anaerococcus porci TaxID=2652269 RepID=UPI002A74A33C|nr:LCP family protein [Anaerococcus porci]MDY3006312.1 LCP family protein [Anaerococcus porci]
MNKSVFGKITSIIFLITYAIFFVFINKYNILPINYRILILFILFIPVLGNLILCFLGKKFLIGKILLFIILLLLSLGEVLFIYYAHKSISTVEEISNSKHQIKNEVSFLVLKDSPIKSIEEIDGKNIITAETIDSKSTTKALESLDSTNLEPIDYTDYVTGAKGLLNGEADLMLLNESFRAMVDENIEGFSEKTRVLKSVLIDEKKEKQEKKQVKEDESFNVFISGIDTYGALSNVSRSDVNMIVSINPRKGKILITSIPRDTYLKIGDMGYDKLTHAGLFGVDTSIKSIENFFNIDIDYFGKVNFTSLKELVDILGGITVENPVEFTTSGGAYHFPQGEIYMDGDMALAFARERYHLEEGDFDRGRNHTRIMTGIIKKLLSPEMLLNFNTLAEIALKSVNTNMSYDKMIELVNKQIEKGQNWDIESQSLEGYGSMGEESLLMPNAQLYMMIPSEDSVKEVRENIIENNK